MHRTPFFKRHPWLTLVFINSTLLLFIFILFEIGLRIFTPTWLEYTMKYLKTGNGFGNGTDAGWKIVFKNNEFYSFTPNSTFKIYYPEYENTVHINSLGGRSTNTNEVTDTRNIIPFTGDSFVMGVGVEDTETVVALTKRILHYNFLNMGISGSCLPIQRKIINKRYDELGRPPVVIYGFFLGNDLNDILKQDQKKMDSSSFSTSANEANMNKGFLWKVNNFIRNNNFLKRLYTLQFIKQKIINIKDKDKNKDREHIDPVFLAMNFSDTSYINLARIAIDKEIQLLSKEPYKSIVVLIPDKHQLNSSIRNSTSKYYNINEKNLNPLLPNEILIETLNKYKIRYIDATSCLMNQPQDKLYYKMDNHFTKEGQLEISKGIADSLNNYIKKVKPIL